VPTGATFSYVTVDNLTSNLTGSFPYFYMPTFDNSTLASGSVNFDGSVSFTTGTNPYEVAIGDIDGDGKPDIVVTNSVANTISVFHNNSSSGSISLSAKVDFTTGTRPEFLTIGDIDGDNKPDLAVVDG
jgi:hypothetical protein